MHRASRIQFSRLTVISFLSYCPNITKYACLHSVSLIAVWLVCSSLTQAAEVRIHPGPSFFVLFVFYKLSLLFHVILFFLLLLFHLFCFVIILLNFKRHLSAIFVSCLFFLFRHFTSTERRKYFF